jgi:hypothetical protein
MRNSHRLTYLQDCYRSTPRGLRSCGYCGVWIGVGRARGVQLEPRHMDLLTQLCATSRPAFEASLFKESKSGQHDTISISLSLNNRFITQCHECVCSGSSPSCYISRLDDPPTQTCPHGHRADESSSLIDTTNHGVGNVSLQCFLAHLCKTSIPSYTIWMLARDVGSSEMLQLLIPPFVGWTCYACAFGVGAIVFVDKLMAALVPDFTLLLAHFDTRLELDYLSGPNILVKPQDWSDLDLPEGFVDFSLDVGRFSYTT